MPRSKLRWFGFAGLFASISLCMAQAPQQQNQGQGDGGFPGGGRGQGGNGFNGGGRGQGGNGFNGGGFGQGGGNFGQGGGNFGQGGGNFGQGGGGFGQFGGGRGGGRGNRGNFDPSQMQGMFGGGNGQQMSREQMMQMWSQFGGKGGGRGNRGGGGPGGWNGGGAPSWGGNPGGWASAAPAADPMANMAEMKFRKMDQNGDGVLNYDEMDDALKSELSKWDTNQDRFIDLAEYKAYFQARLQQVLGGDGSQGGADADVEKAEEEKRPIIYRAGKLPKELPDWFAELDTDRDTQVAVYEWKKSGRSWDEFDAMDRNGDGFLTVEEVLHATRGPAANMIAGARGPGGPGGMGSFDRSSNFFPGGEDGGNARMMGKGGPRMGKGNRGAGKGRGGDGMPGGGKGKGGGRGGKGGGRGMGGGDAFNIDDDF